MGDPIPLIIKASLETASLNDFQSHVAHEGFGIHVSHPSHNLNRIKKTWTDDNG